MSRKYTFLERLAFLFGAELPTDPEPIEPIPPFVRPPFVPTVRRGVILRKRHISMLNCVGDPLSWGYTEQKPGFAFLIACDDETGREHITVEAFVCGNTELLSEGDRVVATTYCTTWNGVCWGLKGDWDNEVSQTAA